MTLIAFHNNPSLKAFVVSQLALHREADKLVKGDYWANGKGCAVGCTLEAVRLHNGKFKAGIDHRSHALYESELGIPRIIARLEDRFFEALPNGDSQAWPERFTSAIRPGADLTMIWPRFAHWVLTEEVAPRTKNPKSLASLAEVGALYLEWIDSTKPNTDRWSDVRMAAAAAASAACAADAYAAACAAAACAADAAACAAAAYAAACAAAACAADAAACAAAAYAASAACGAYYAADAGVGAHYARIASYRRQSDKLIELLGSA